MRSPALLLIDFQIAFDSPVWGARNNPEAEKVAGRLLAHWRARGWPIIHIQHVSTEPGSPLGPEAGMLDFKPEVTPLPGEPTLQKHVNSGFIGTDLEDRLRKAGVTDVVICGLTTPHCVSTTARMAANLGFNVQIMHDACAATAANGDASWNAGLEPPSPQAIHDAALTHLHGEFAQVRGSEHFLES